MKGEAERGGTAPTLKAVSPRDPSGCLASVAVTLSMLIETSVDCPFHFVTFIAVHILTRYSGVLTCRQMTVSLEMHALYNLSFRATIAWHLLWAGKVGKREYLLIILSIKDATLTAVGSWKEMRAASFVVLL